MSFSNKNFCSIALLDVIAKADEFGEVVNWTESSAKEVDELTEEIRTSLVNKTSERFERSKKVSRSL